MKNILTIFRKEFDRVIKDKRLVLTVILMPGLMIYLLYTLMGNSINNMLNESNEHVAIVYVVNAPDEFLDIAKIDFNADFTAIEKSEVENSKPLLLEKKLDLIIVFDEGDFMGNLINRQNPNIDLFYNPSEITSNNAYLVILTKLTKFEEIQKAEIYDNYGDLFSLNKSNSEIVMDENKASAKGLAGLLPFLIITFLFSAAMSIGPESISGEKERGTIATMLITPIKRKELAIGKVLSLSTLSMISAISSFIGILLSLPKIMGDTNTNIYGMGEYSLIFLILIITVAVIVAMISIISCYAKTVKEASVFILPLYFVSMIIGITTMFSNGAETNTIMYLIPIFNSVHMLVGIMLFEVNYVHLLVTIITNIFLTVSLIFILTKMFESEKIMFAK